MILSCLEVENTAASRTRFRCPVPMLHHRGGIFYCAVVSPKLPKQSGNIDEVGLTAPHMGYRAILAAVTQIKLTQPRIGASVFDLHKRRGYSLHGNVLPIG